MNKTPFRMVRPLLRLSAVVAVLGMLAGCASAMLDAPAAPPNQSRLDEADNSAPHGRSKQAASAAAKSPTKAAAAPQRTADASTRQPSGHGHEHSGETLPDNELTAQIMFQVLAAEVAAQRDEGGNAIATYLALARQTRDPRFARRATELALAAGSLETAMEGAQLWHEFAPASAVATQTWEMLLLSANRLQEAEPLLASRRLRAEAQGSLAGFYRQLLRSLGRVNDRQSALAMFDRISAQDRELPEVRITAAELARAAGQPERAASEVMAAHALAPDDEQLTIQAARVLVNGGQNAPKALALLAKFLERKPDASEARLQYARLLSTSGDNTRAREQLEIGLRAAPENPAILFSLAQLAYQAEQLDTAQGYLDRYLALPASTSRDNAPAYLFLAQIEEDRKHPDKAIDWLSKITRGEQFMPALIRRSLLMARSGQLEQARSLLQGTQVSTDRQRIQLLAAEAQVLRDAGRLDDAFKVLDSALATTPDNPDLLYDHAMAAERLNRIEVMEQSLRKLIKLRPDNAHAYNALGYSFADRNMRLPEAQALIEKALELAPTDVHIMDSMGWVLFRTGKLQQAADLLQRAFDMRPEAEVAVHLGEVLWSLGQKEQARQVWIKARELEPGNSLLTETLKRLGVTL